MSGKMYSDYDNFTVGLDDLVMLFKDGKNVITTIRELRGVVNDLISGGANSPLSAEQGVKLLDRIEDFLYQKVEGTATEIELPMKTLVDGYFKNFIAKYDNDSESTTVNEVPLYKPGTNTPPKIVATRAYTIRYSKAENCFFLEASATGNALESDVLAGKIFSTENGVDLVGTLNLSSLVSGNIKSGVTINGISGKSSVVDTADANAIASQILSGVTAYINAVKVTGSMPNNGAVSPTLASNNQEYTIAAGYHNGLGKVKAIITNLVAGVIKAGTTVGGIVGTFTSDATATASEILSGETAYINAVKVTGSMNNNAAVSSTLTSNNQEYTIPAGYHNGLGKIKAVITNLVASVIKAGTTVGGIVGTFTSDATATAAQIVSGASAYVNGIKIIGTLVVPNCATGSITSSASQVDFGGQSHCYVDITGFNFTPKIAVLVDPANTQEKLSTVLVLDHFIIFPGNTYGGTVNIAGSAIVTNGRLKMPANQGNRNYNYYIFG